MALILSDGISLVGQMTLFLGGCCGSNVQKVFNWPKYSAKEGKKRDLQKGPEGSLLVRVITSIRAYFVDPLHLRSIVYAATVWNKRFLGKPIKCQTN